MSKKLLLTAVVILAAGLLFAWAEDKQTVVNNEVQVNLTPVNSAGPQVKISPEADEIVKLNQAEDISSAEVEEAIAKTANTAAATTGPNPNNILRKQAEAEADVEKEVALDEEVPAEVRLEQIKADGKISPDEMAEYEAFMSESDQGQLPIPSTQISETEPNDDCASANALACGDTVWCAEINFGTPADFNDYFTFTLDNTYAYWNVTLETLDPNGICTSSDVGDTKLYLYDDVDCLNQIGYDDDGGGGLFSLITKTLTPGTYTARVTPYATSTTPGAYHLSLTCAEGTAPLPGEDCSDPIIITSLPYTDSRNSCNYINDHEYSGPDVVYEFVLTDSTHLEFTLCSSADVFYDYLWLYAEGNCGGSQITYWSTGCPSGSAMARGNRLLGPGTYQVIVDGSSTTPNCGNYTLEIHEYVVPTGRCCYYDEDPPDLFNPICVDDITDADCDVLIGIFSGTWNEALNCTDNPCPVPPANDDCANAMAITEGTYTVNNFYATSDGEGTHTIYKNVWFCYTASVDGIALLDLCPTNFDTEMAAYLGCSCSPLGMELNYNDDDNLAYCDADYNQSAFEIGISAGQTYLIEAGNFSSSSSAGGDLVLTITETACTAPANDDCANAVVLNTFPATGSGTNFCASNSCAYDQDVWYEIVLPYAWNNISIEVCPTEINMDNGGISLSLDCACSGFINADDFVFPDLTCTEGYEGLSMNFENVDGSLGSIFWPAWVVDADGHGIAFNYTVNVDSAAGPPLGEDCANPIVIADPIGYTDTRNSCDYVHDYEYTGPDVVYTFTLTESKFLTMKTCNSPEDFYAIIWIYDEFNCGGTQLDYAAYTDCPSGNQTYLEYNFAPGTYYLIVDGSGAYTPNCGTYTLEIDEWQPPTGRCCYFDEDPPDLMNPICADAISESDCNDLIGDFSGAWTQDLNCTDDPCPVPSGQGDWCGDPYIIPETFPYSVSDSSCNYGNYCDITGTDNSDVIYELTLTETRMLELSMCDTTAGGDYITNYDSKLAVFEGQCCTGAGTELHYNDDFCGTRSQITALFAPGVYYIVVDGYSTACGGYKLDITELPRCELTCDPGDVDEGEPDCGFDYVDTYNGGCNSDPAVFQTISLNTTICGTSGNFRDADFSNIRDTDWFEVTLTEAGTLTWTVAAEFPVLIFIMDAGSGDCNDYVSLGSATADPCSTAELSFLVGSGTYWLWVGPSVFSGWPCPLTYEASVTFTAGAPGFAVAPESVEGAAEPAGSDSETLTVTNTGLLTLDFSAAAVVDPTVTRLDGSVEYIYEPPAVNSMPEPVGYRPSEDKDGGDAPYYPPVITSSGGPDAYGYTWIDSDEAGGPTYSWIDISTIGTEINWPTAYDSLDDQVVNVPMGMNFEFYGITYSNLTICTNGWASFTATASDLSDDPIPSTATPNALLAVYWDDLEGQYPAGVYGSAYYYYNAAQNQFIISWTNWHHYVNSQNLNFQIILDGDNNSITYQYGIGFPHSQTDYAIGIENEDGTIGLQVARNQAYTHADLAVLFMPPQFWLTLDVTSGSIPPGGPGVDLLVTMDATELDAGIYTGRIAFTTNDPENTSASVPVRFVVGGLGLIKGVVSDYNTMLPIEGAAVTATNTALSTVSDVTNAQGEYRIWITPGAADVDVEAVGYIGASSSTTVVRDDSVTVDFDLFAPIADIDTDSIAANMAVGDTAVYQRVLTNTGSATLNYSVGLELNGGALAGIRILTDPIERLVPIVDVGDHETSAFDRSPYGPIYGDAPIILAFSDLRFDMDIQSVVGDNQCLGMEFDGTYFWITGGGNGADPNKLYKVSVDGVLQAAYDQPTTGWGWRDLAWDGTYLYGCDDSYTIRQIDPATGGVTGVTITGPLSPNRALAYDPATDHFWTANWNSNIYEFSRTGAVINQYTNAKQAYGMAWQPAETDGGPILWVFSQDGTGANLSQLTPVNPANGAQGTSFQAAFPAGYDSTMAGGACYAGGLPGVPYGMVLTMNQGFPTDYIAGYELFEAPPWVSVIAGASGSLEPTEQATIEFKVDFRDTTVAIPGETYLANAVINNNSVATPVIPMRFTLAGGGYEYVPGDANMFVGQWPPQVIGGDVTFLVNYFRGVVQACIVGGFYCSGDANADCQVIGSDVTRMVNYFRGISSILPCPDYEPAWPTPSEVPPVAPAGWPNCETPPVTSGKALPSGGTSK